MIVVGIVGAPAGGKSTVARLLEAFGATWINADLIAREVLNRPEVVLPLKDRFGAEIVNDQGEIDRRKLASHVFGDDAKSVAGLRYLEALTHPPTRQEIHHRLQQAKDLHVPIAVLDIPLLFESKWDHCCDEIWFVESSRENRLQRAVERGWDQGELSRRESSQLPLHEKRRLSQRTITNDGTLEQLQTQIKTLYLQLIQRQGEPKGDQHCL